MTTFANTGLRYSTPLTINSIERVHRSETLNLKIQTVSNDAQRWELMIALEPDASRDPTPKSAALGVHRHSHGLTKSFTTAMPQTLGTRAEGDVTITDASSWVRGSDVNLVGKKEIGVGFTAWPPVSLGRYISIGTHPKIYEVTSVGRRAGTNTARIGVFPALVVAATGVVNTSPDVTCYYADDGVVGLKYEQGILTKATVRLVEALS